jgi:hypothetical protein
MVSLPVLPLALLRGWSETASPNIRGLPALVYKLSSLEEKLKVAYKTTTEGKFTEALRYDPMNDLCNRPNDLTINAETASCSLDNGAACMCVTVLLERRVWGAPSDRFVLCKRQVFLSIGEEQYGVSSVLCRLFINILHIIPVVVVDSRKEVDEVKELLGIAKDYALALRIELKRKDPALKDDPVRQAELAAYFTHCTLQPTHLKLSLQSAMSICFKLKNFGTAATFARRLLELSLSPQVATRARQVLRFCSLKYAVIFIVSSCLSFGQFTISSTTSETSEV